MAHYVMSDLYGEADRFHAMLKKIRLSSEDTLYILGDVIDRDSHGIRLLRASYSVQSTGLPAAGGREGVLRLTRPTDGR